MKSTRIEPEMVAKGEKTKDLNGASESQMTPEDAQLLSQISARISGLGLTQDEVNGLTDSLSTIEDNHAYLVALDDALESVDRADELADLPGYSRSLYTAGATYPLGCYNKSVQYQIQVRTSAVESAGTDANVYVKWKGKYRTNPLSGYTIPLLLDTPANDHERGALFDKTFTTPSRGDIAVYNSTTTTSAVSRAGCRRASPSSIGARAVCTPGRWACGSRPTPHRSTARAG